jgi:hypothetical protein
LHSFGPDGFEPSIFRFKTIYDDHFMQVSELQKKLIWKFVMKLLKLNFYFIASCAGREKPFLWIWNFDLKMFVIPYLRFGIFPEIGSMRIYVYVILWKILRFKNLSIIYICTYVPIYVCTDAVCTYCSKGNITIVNVTNFTPLNMTILQS